MERIEIPLNKLKIFFILLGAVALIITSYAAFANYGEHNSLFYKIIGAVGVLFFGVGFLAGLKIIFRSEAAIIIDENGITDYASFVSSGFIPWSEIKAIKTTKVESSGFILIVVKNPKTYIDRASFWKKRLMRGNFKYLGTPVHIPFNTVKYDSKELVKIIKSRWNISKTKKSN